MNINHPAQITPNPISTSTQNTDAVNKTGKIQGTDNTLSNPQKLPIQDTILIGRGSSIAYFLTEMSDKYEKQKLAGENPQEPLKNVTVIGSSEPWSKEVRGSGFINHQNELIDTWGEKAPDYNKNYADRQQFSDANTAQINRSVSFGANEINDEVLNVQKGEDGLFKVSTKQGHEFLARNVVLGIGAGPHTNAMADGKAPDLSTSEKRLNNITVNDKEALKGKVLDLDEFMRLTDNQESLKGKTVVVHGPNAGIDAVERAGSLGAEVKWFIRSTAPVLLDGNQLEHAPKAAKESLVKVDKVDISAGKGDKMQLNFTHNDKTKTQDKLDADFYVYALGQDSEKTGAIKSVLDKSIQQNLEPIYDIDQIYSDKPYNTVLGIRSKSDSGENNNVVILGASVAQMAGGVQHTYLSQVEDRLNEMTQKLGLPDINVSRLKEELVRVQQEVDSSATEKLTNLSAQEKASYQTNLAILKKDLAHYQIAQNDLANSRGIAPQVERVVETEVASVVVSPQLATVKATVGAITNIVPNYVHNGENNYSSDNRTMLRIGLADSFPNIPENDAEHFIRDVINLRVMNQSDFREAVVSDFKQYTSELLKTGTPEQVSIQLAERHIKPMNADALVRAVQQQNDDELRGLIGVQLDNGAIPAWGTPDHVRYGYASKLSDLHLGVENQVPLSLFWLEEPISEANAIRV